MTQIIRKISFLRIVVELTLVNVLILAACVWQNMSSYNTSIFTVSMNGLFIIYMLAKMNTYRLLIDDESLIAFNFRLGKLPEKQIINIENASATYVFELAGRGIRQKKLKAYENDRLKMALEPGLTGWSHNDLDKIVTELVARELAIKIDED